MKVGTVKWYSAQKGYGFIQPEDNSADVFVHVSALEKAGLMSLSEGQKVNYELATNKGRTSAANIQVIN
jgi:CspA family cold shock protein